jgi:NADH-quinone oxidoreductase subunit M
MGFFGLFALSALGFPGTNSFVGEALVLIGVFMQHPWVGAVAVPGVMLAAAYMLRLGQKLAWGEPTRATAWKDLNAREWLYLAPLAVLVIYIGLAPGLTLRSITPTLTRVLTEVRSRAVTAEAALPQADWLSQAASPAVAGAREGEGL